MAFRGQHEHSLDSKDRLTVPRKFRDALADGFGATAETFGMDATFHDDAARNPAIESRTITRLRSHSTTSTRESRSLGPIRMVES